MLTCAVWVSQWHYLAVIIHCDNLTTFAAINSGYGQVTQLMHLLRCLFFIGAQFRLTVYAVHTGTVKFYRGCYIMQ